MGYWNEISMKETREIIQNERDCLKSRAEADAALEAQGRFKRQNETQIVGSGPPTYPRQPEGSPWAYADCNPEPPFDTDISAVEPILPERRDDAPSNGLTSAVEQVAPGEPVANRSRDGRLSTPNSKSWRRF
jgi:hypothetical protein